MHGHICRCACLTIGVLSVATAAAQVTIRVDVPPATVIVVPQVRAFVPASTAAAVASVEITSVEAAVVISRQTATTTMDIHLRNHTGARQQAELLLPVPEKAVVRGFAHQGAASEPTAQILPADEARRTYDSIVARTRDPALLEFLGCDLIRSSVFPVEAGGTQTIRLTYEQLLPADGSRVDYVLPRSESLGYNVPWKITARVESDKPVSTVYSPSHDLEIRRSSEKTISVRTTDGASRQPGPFRLSYLLQQDKVTASLMAYPDASAGGGYFLLLAGLPAAPEDESAPAMKREITLVIDRSGSMSGQKIEQARKAGLQVLAGLAGGETFRVIAYDDVIESLSPEPLTNTPQNAEKARAFINALTARGSTNLHGALKEALRPVPAEDMLPIVLFLTDGLATAGDTSEVSIRNVAARSNPYNRRVFTFGVGVDVNTPLLEKIAYETRATPTFVLPGEDVEAKVAQVYKRLTGPVLAEPAIEVVDESGQSAPGRIRRVLPARIPDLFEGDQLVLLGQYEGDKPLTLKLQGNYRGKTRTFRFTFDLDKASTRNAFVPRLWASRRIAELIDDIRQQGADMGHAMAAHSAENSRIGGGRGEDPYRGGGATVATDPRLKELIDEIVRLSREFGILTEYTAYLAREGTDLSRADVVFREAQRNFIDRGMSTRSGLGAVNQSLNQTGKMAQKSLDYRNQYYDQSMNQISISNVQQVNDRAFFNRSGRWIDSRIIDRESTIKPSRTVEFGSDEYRDLVSRLLQQGRQGVISLRGDILIEVDGQIVLVRAPETTEGVTR